MNNENIKPLNLIEFIYSCGEKITPEEFKDSGRKVDLTIIWLHGLGATGDDFVPIVSELGLSQSIHFIFPHAPIQAVTINGGMKMPSWYDILEMIEERKISEDEFDISVWQIQQIINEKIKQGANARKFLIIGFSQGGAIAINAALSYPKKLLGVLALSTYIAKEPSIHLENANTPVYWFHGSYDNVVPFSLSQKAMDYFAKKKNSFSLKTYPMAHQVCMEQIKDIAKVIDGMIKRSE